METSQANQVMDLIIEKSETEETSNTPYRRKNYHDCANKGRGSSSSYSEFDQAKGSEEVKETIDIFNFQTLEMEYGRETEIDLYLFGDRDDRESISPNLENRSEISNLNSSRYRSL